MTIGEQGATYERTFDWRLPVAVLNEDLFGIAFVSNSGKRSPSLTSGRDEIKVRVRKSGGNLNASSWCESNVVYAYFGWFDLLVD